MFDYARARTRLFRRYSVPAVDTETTRLVMTLDEASLAGVFPDGKAGTRRPPRIEYLGVRARVGPQPLKEIEDQAVDAASHRNPANHRAGYEPLLANASVPEYGDTPEAMCGGRAFWGTRRHPRRYEHTAARDTNSIIFCSYVKRLA